MLASVRLWSLLVLLALAPGTAVSAHCGHMAEMPADHAAASGGMDRGVPDACPDCEAAMDVCPQVACVAFVAIVSRSPEPPAGERAGFELVPDDSHVGLSRSTDPPPPRSVALPLTQS